MSVYEFYGLKSLIILEQVNTSVVEKRENEKISMVRVCKLSLYADEYFDDYSVYLIFDDDQLLITFRRKVFLPSIKKDIKIL